MNPRAYSTLCLGVDPGLASMGWGAVGREGAVVRYVSDGTLHTAPGDDDERRAVHLARSMRDVVEGLRPDVVAVERWVFYPSAKPHQAHALGLVIGALLAALPPTMPLVLLRAVDTRAHLGLRASASKEEVARRASLAMRGMQGASVHSRDALALAVVGLGHARGRAVG